MTARLTCQLDGPDPPCRLECAAHEPARRDAVHGVLHGEQGSADASKEEAVHKHRLAPEVVSSKSVDDFPGGVHDVPVREEVAEAPVCGAYVVLDGFLQKHTHVLIVLIVLIVCELARMSFSTPDRHKLTEWSLWCTSPCTLRCAHLLPPGRRTGACTGTCTTVTTPRLVNGEMVEPANEWIKPQDENRTFCT